MTVIINTFWGGKVSQVVDRQISRKVSEQNFSAVDDESNKVVIALTKDALLSIAYTGVAVAHSTWMDCIIAKCLAHRDLPVADTGQVCFWLLMINLPEIIYVQTRLISNIGNRKSATDCYHLECGE